MSARRRFTLPVCALLAVRALPAVCAVLALSGCAGPTGGPASVALWPDEASWVPWPQGWARAVPLEGERTVVLDGRGGRFRAVAIPSGESATLELSAGSNQTERSFSVPTAIDFELGPADSLSLVSPEGVHLLRPRLVDPSRQPRRILFVMADTLRFDHATAEFMPEISTDFAGSLRFERAYSPASWTLPSVASIFSGELPAKMRGPDGSLISLPTRTSTLAEELSERGYATVGITANYTVHHENHYSAGFDLFLVPDPKVGQFADITWLRQLALEAASWLDDEDLFLYLQPMEAHDPYRNHETGEALPAPHTGDIVSEAELAALRRAYASEAGYLSRELSRLREELPAFDLEILTSDHGEEFFEHGGFRHGPALYPESVHVPLWIQGAGLSAGQIDQPVSLVGLKDAVVAAAEGVLLGDLTEASLAPLMEERPVTAETFSFGPPRWSLIRDDRQAIFFARPAPPKPAEHPVERWLLEHQPRVLVAPLDGETLDPTERSLMARSVRSLIDQFAGWRRGLYLLFEDGSGGTVRIRGVENEGLVWGDAERIEVSPDGAGLRLDVTSASPFALVLLPALEGEQPTVELAGQKIELEGSTPIRHAGGSVVLWLDAGRPKEEALEVESTLERLRALSYI